VICHLSDWETALRLKACLEADCRYAALLPLQHVDDERIRLRDHRQSLRECDAVLVYWGAAAGEPWFRDQLREVIGARKRRRQVLPAVCVSSPPDVRRDLYRRPDLPLEQLADIRCDAVRAVIRQLEPAAKGAHA
jgi:hypothetical protein